MKKLQYNEVNFNFLPLFPLLFAEFDLPDLCQTSSSWPWPWSARNAALSRLKSLRVARGLRISCISIYIYIHIYRYIYIYVKGIFNMYVPSLPPATPWYDPETLRFCGIFDLRPSETLLSAGFWRFWHCGGFEIEPLFRYLLLSIHFSIVLIDFPYCPLRFLILSHRLILSCLLLSVLSPYLSLYRFIFNISIIYLYRLKLSQCTQSGCLFNP